MILKVICLSPILAAEKPIRRGIIRNSTRALGLEHKEEAVWRIGANQIGFRTETYGDSDALEMELSNLATCRLRIHGTIDGYVKVGDPLKGNPFVHCPAFDWTGTVAHTSMRQETAALRDFDPVFVGLGSKAADQRGPAPTRDVRRTPAS